MKVNDKTVSLVLTPGTFGNQEKPMRYFYDATKDLYELTIYGEGEMIDFASSTDQPWNVFNSQMKKLYIEEGIKTIGKNAFSTHSIMSFGNLIHLFVVGGIEGILNFSI